MWRMLAALNCDFDRMAVIYGNSNLSRRARPHGLTTEPLLPPRLQAGKDFEQIIRRSWSQASLIKMLGEFDGIWAFVRTVEAGSFSAAARQLDVTPSAVSKQIARLEQRLSVTLFNRNSRGLALTEAGQEYYEHCARGLAEFRKADEQIDALRAQPAGLLRVALPQGFGSVHIAPHIPEFLRQYPDLSVDLVFDRVASEHLVRPDVIISATDPPDESMVVRTLSPIQRVACASPKYIEKYGRPETLDDLERHNCLILSRYGSLADYWVVKTEGGATEVPVMGNFRTNSYEAHYIATVQGVGIGYIPTYMAAKALQTGELIALFQDDRATGSRTTFESMNLYYPQSRYRLPKVRAFVDFVLKLFDR
jgi:DNA-binding transcriptional LysR family regulator